MRVRTRELGVDGCNLLAVEGAMNEGSVSLDTLGRPIVETGARQTSRSHPTEPAAAPSTSPGVLVIQSADDDSPRPAPLCVEVDDDGRSCRCSLLEGCVPGGGGADFDG